MRSGRRFLALAVAAAAPSCSPGPLAKVDGHRLTIDKAAELIASNSAVAADTQVVRAVAELWVDYTLLTRHLLADTALESLDVSALAQPSLEAMTLSRLTDQVLDVDTVVTDAELAARFAADLPGARATASQILLLFPRSATTRQRDSVLAMATDLRGQLLRGGDFALLASRFSGDPGSGPRGGRMGTFGRGEMLGPVDSAVFSLEPGALSTPVRTDLGYHLLRLDGLEVPALSDVGARFRAQIQGERRREAEAAYLLQLDSVVALELAPGAGDIVRGLAASMPRRLARAAADQPLVTWSGGYFSVEDFLTVMRRSGPGFAQDVAAASHDELEAVLFNLSRRVILLEEARMQGLEPSSDQADSVLANVRALVRSRARDIGLLPLEDGVPETDTSDAPPGTGGQSTAAEIVEAALVRIVSGRQEVIPLGAVIALLRDQGSWDIDESAVHATVSAIRGDPG